MSTERVHALLAPRSPEDFERIAAEGLKEARERLKEITRLSGPRTPRDTLRPLDKLVADISGVIHAVSLLRSVHPDPRLRQAAERREQELASFATELALDRDLYDAVRRCDTSELDAVGRRLYERILRDFHRAGVDRDARVRREVQELREELVALSQEFSRNILSDVRTVYLDGVEELEGLPEDYIRRHAPDAEGRIAITTEYPDYQPYMVYARSGRRREELYRAFRSRAHPQNVPVLRKILERRHRLATLLGYASWADYVTEDKMIQNAASVAEFIDRVTKASEKRSAYEYEVLLERKRRDEPEAQEVYDWERSYYEELVRQERFQVDSRELRPYFEYARVKEGLLELASELFGLRFEPASGAPRWHEDVEVYDVYENGRRAGRVYLDMHPREGKFKHAAMFPLLSGLRGRSLPEAALVCNFQRPEPGGEPALLEHDDVVTLFHEFGHLLHQLSSRDHEWVEFSGTGTEWDFVEVPSQLMEEWAWDPLVLERFALDHRTGRPIPRELVESLRRARHFGRGLHVRQQMFYASLSLKYHATPPDELDIEEVLRELHNRYSRFRFVEDTHFHTSFGHLDTYSAAYYTYMWSLVIEKDLLQVFRREGLLNPQAARRYRDTVLAAGGTKDARDLVRAFLGRDYDFEAFERWLEGD